MTVVVGYAAGGQADMLGAQGRATARGKPENIGRGREPDRRQHADRQPVCGAGAVRRPHAPSDHRRHDDH